MIKEDLLNPYASSDNIVKFLQDYEAGIEKESIITPEKVWDDFERFRNLTCADTTVNLDIRYKEMYITKSSIWTKDVSKMTKDDAYAFFNFCKEEKKRPKERKKGVRDAAPEFRQKYWWQIQATVSALWDYLFERGYVKENIFKNLCFHPNNFDEVLYTPEEDTVYSDSEADGRKMLHIQREVVSKKGGGYKLLPHCKTKAGDRFLPLNNFCLTILHRIKQLQYFAGHETVTQTLEYIRRKADTDIEEFLLDDSGLFEEYSEVTEKVTKVTDFYNNAKVPRALIL